MTTLFKCDFCGETFSGVDGFYNCKEHELTHQTERSCKHCMNSYYVYNIEHRCEFSDKCSQKNCWKFFRKNVKGDNSHE